MLLNELNALSHSDAMAALLDCCASRRWAGTVASGRPYASVRAVRRSADEASRALAWPDIEEAMTAHPRIGDREEESGTDDQVRTRQWSRREQAGVADAQDDVLAALREGNRAYERRFGHVFLICATGLTAEAMLASLRARLSHDVESERAVVSEELAKITRLRLERLVSA